MSRNRLTLVGLFLIWAGIIIYNAGMFRKVPAGNGGLEKKVSSAEDALRFKVRLDLLEMPHPPYEGVKKDIFTPLLPPPPPIIKAPELPLPPSPIEGFSRRVRFVGFLEKEERKTIFLNIANEVILVKGGDVVEGRFRVVELTERSLRFQDVETTEELTFDIAR